MRGVKGWLLEGGIRVPMFAYWKGKILPGQVIEEMVTTLDFTATTVALGGGQDSSAGVRRCRPDASPDRHG